MTKPAAWIELMLDRIGSEIRISARGSRNENMPPRPLGIDVPTLLKVSSDVERAASTGRPLAPETRALTQTIHQAVLGGEVAMITARSQEATNASLLMRLLIQDPELQAFPWEALCAPGEALGYWGVAQRECPARGIASNVPWLPREIKGTVKVLAIAPTDGVGLQNLKQSLANPGVEWQNPIVGPDAHVNTRFLEEQLRRRTGTHVVHFLGHGAIRDGMPSLRMADQNGDEKWLAAEIFAKSLMKVFEDTLRLVVLEACEGAQPGAFASAAETLVKAGIDAVVAHLWPIRADVALECSTSFYSALAGANGSGNVAESMNAARMSVLSSYEYSAEAMSPVLYLRGPSGTIFDFEKRIPIEETQHSRRSGGNPIPPALQRIITGDFSLLLGDRWRDDYPTLETFRNKLHRELENVSPLPPAGLPMGTLAQWYVLHNNDKDLEIEFQDAFKLDRPRPSILTSIARLLRPGVHTTLLRDPWLEDCLAEEQPDRTIYAIQPHDSGSYIMKRMAGAGKEWVTVKKTAPDKYDMSFDVKQDILVLRPYRGYSLLKKFDRPLLTEDDYFVRLREFWEMSRLPVDLVNKIKRGLQNPPALLVGLSVRAADHRAVLHTLHQPGLPRESLAIVDEDDKESGLWTAMNLPGRNEGVEVIATSSASLGRIFQALAQGQAQKP